MNRRRKIHPKPVKGQLKSKKNKIKHKKGIWYCFRYSHLKEEIQQYDGEISGCKYIILQGIFAAAVYFFCEMFQMQILYRLWVIAVGILLFPALWRNQVRRKFEHKRFTEVGIYMEQMLYAFQKEEKIVTALKNVQTLFSKGRMYKVIEQAVTNMETDYYSESPVHTALLHIEEVYECDRLHAIHQFMEKVEALGGKFDNSIELLLNEKHLWEKRVEDRRKETASIKRNVSISMLLSLMVCISALYFMPEDINMLSFQMTHLSAAVVLILNLIIFYKADQKLTCNWLKEEVERNEEVLQKQYLRFIHYDEKKERKKSFKYSILPAMCMVSCLMCHQTGKGILFGVIWIVCLVQHKIGHRLNLNCVMKEVEKAFPAWMMEIALLLQVDNVQVSLKKTYSNAPAILKPALEEMLQKMEYCPEAITPYTEFLKELELPGIQAAMKMLYAISNGSGGNAQQQIYEIIQRNNLLMDKAEKIRQEETTVGCNIYFLLPMLSGTLKLILDLSVFLLSFLNMGGQAGI